MKSGLKRRPTMIGASAVALAALLGTSAPDANDPTPAVRTVAATTTGKCPWSDASKSPDRRAGEYLAAATLDQKIKWLNEKTANVADPSMCTPTIKYTDGSWGVGSDATGVTAFPDPIVQAATWSDSLSRDKGQAQAEEAWQKGRNVILGPGVNLTRTPLGGRTSEYLGEDPLLAGTLAADQINGIEHGNPNIAVEAILKHFFGNQQELDRTLSSSDMAERTERELYAHAFEVALGSSDPSGVMCAYPQVNDVYACENTTLLRQILKTDLNYQGFVVSDFGAVHSTGRSIAAGLDQELGAPTYFTPTLIKKALANGEISQRQIDEAVYRILRAHFAAGLFDKTVPTETGNVVSTTAHQTIARSLAEQGSVLLRNQANQLPLTGKNLKIAVIGPTSSNQATNGVSASTICTARGFDRTKNAVSCPHPIAPLDAIRDRAARDGGTVTWNQGTDPASAAAAAKGADVAVVFGYDGEGEGQDLPNLSLDYNGDAVISAVAAANPNTVVVLETGGPVLMPWLDNVKAVLEAWYPGEQQGAAIAHLLWGDMNPSGKLPVSFPRQLADIPTNTAAQYPGVFANGSTIRPSGDNTSIRQVSYTEGLQIGYRWYDARNITPLFPFGYGLSYTSYQYRNLQVSPASTVPNNKLTTTVDVTNTGGRAGREIVQLYATLPAEAAEPPKRLIGWQAVTLNPGETKRVTITTDPSDTAVRPLSYWDQATSSWRIASGTYSFQIGSSSRDIRGSFPVQVNP